MRINDVLKGKARTDVVTIRPEATVRELVAQLAEHNVGALVVSTDGRSIGGIVSERDVVRRLGADLGVLDQPVEAIMTSTVQTCEGSDEVTRMMQVMTEHRVRHVPVVSEGALVGIVSIGDLVKHRIDELEFERDQLEGYLHQS